MFLVVDTETTGLYSDDEVLEIAVVDSDYQTLLHTYLRPEHHTEWPESQAIHGISPEFIFSGNFPTMQEIKPRLKEIFTQQKVIMYSASFDSQFMREELTDSTVKCAMLAFAEHYGSWNEYYGNYRWQKLITAAKYVCHEWQHDSHSAIGDALATVSVWKYLIDPQEQARVKELKKQQEREEMIEWQAKRYLQELANKQKEEEWSRNIAFNNWFFPLAQIKPDIPHYASDSAEVFCPLVTGYELSLWQKYDEWLNLPHYDKEPAHLVTERAFYELQKVTPEAMFFGKVRGRSTVYPLYDLTKMVLGQDYVPYIKEWPANSHSATTLKKKFKLKDKQIVTLKKVGYKTGKYVSYFIYEYVPGITQLPVLSEEELIENDLPF
jgi:DNA polymerase-3 subunit epsilon